MTTSRTSIYFRSAATLAAALALGACSMMPMGGDGSMSKMAAGTKFGATLSAAAEVPANSSPGSGMLDATLDPATMKLHWKLSYSGLTGPATAAHFHGPAMAGANAGVVVPLPGAASPSEGDAMLTAAQVADLTAGKWYVNVHTAVNPGGEIRGQVMAK
jgi:CHRD domain